MEFFKNVLLKLHGILSSVCYATDSIWELLWFERIAQACNPDLQQRCLLSSNNNACEIEKLCS